MPSLPRDKRTEQFFKRIAMQFERCLAPGTRCTQKPVRAHSIQNQQVLEALAESGHVMMFDLKIDRVTGPRVELQKVGHSKATTFTGLCTEHDSTLFRPIDTGILDLRNSEHLFLLAYRSVLREFHTKLRAANMSQAIYRDTVESGQVSSESPSPIGMEAVMQIAEAYSFYRFKFECDKWYLSASFQNISHEIIKLEGTGPVLAVSSMYNIVDNMVVLKRRLDPEFLILNVFPDESDTTIVFSYKTRQRDVVASYLREIQAATSYYQRYLLSKTILANCENLVLSPKFCSKLSDDQIRVIKDYFAITIRNRDAAVDDHRLMLF